MRNQKLHLSYSEYSFLIIYFRTQPIIVLKTILKQHFKGCNSTHSRGRRGLLPYITYDIICFVSFLQYSWVIHWRACNQSGFKPGMILKKTIIFRAVAPLLLKLKSVQQMRQEFAEVKMITSLKKSERDVLVLVFVTFLWGNRQVTSFFFPVGHQFLFFISECLTPDLWSCLQNPRIQVGYARGGAKMYSSFFKKDSIAGKMKAR